jgi:hypothetical protein
MNNEKWHTVTANIKEEKWEKLNSLLAKVDKTPNQFSKRLFELLADDEKLFALLVKKVGLSQ